MIQDIEPHRLINHYEPGVRPSGDDFCLFFRGRDTAVRIADDGGIVLPRVRECFPEDEDGGSARADAKVPEDEAGRADGELSGGEESPVRYLFTLDRTAVFWMKDESAEPPRSFIFRNVRSLRKSGAGPRERIFALVTALQLVRWYRDNRFCGTCGSALTHSLTERAMECPSCGRIIYPRIIPAVIVGVTNGDRLLLTRYQRNRGVPFYALVAGFTEIGESLEQTVSREVMEETGLRIRNIRYYKSQPWAIADDILAGFYCDVDGDDTIRLEEDELSEGIWVKREDITGQPDDFSLTNEMMMTFRYGKEPR